MFVRRIISIPNNILLFSVSKFYYRIVNKNLDVDQLSNIRKVETLLTLSIKEKC